MDIIEFKDVFELLNKYLSNKLNSLDKRKLERTL